MELKEYLDNFEEKLQQEILRLCTNYKFLNGTLLATDDIDNYWQVIAPEYMADAVEQVQDYPTVSVAWAAGFDDMDEHLIRDIIGIPLESEDAKDIEEMIRRCAQKAIDLIRHEQIEPQSPVAFHVFTRAVRVMYRTRAAIQLKNMGYKFEKVSFGDC